MDKAYSLNGETFHEDFSTVVEEALENDAKVGDTYFELDIKRLEPSDMFKAYNFLDDLENTMYDLVGGDVASGYTDGVSEEAQQELEYLVHDWIAKYADPSNYWQGVGKPFEVKFTKDDLEKIND